MRGFGLLRDRISAPASRGSALVLTQKNLNSRAKPAAPRARPMAMRAH